ncbi:hypothetical protein [Saccharothrix sp. S26]|uniref:hypothetical protein n=1 Tax=Saccharothrix sp. S26 TaxID=2907215 RepID=UPI0027E184E7|nr:hypothetical protein [Saccharothrix sp. S26]
MIDASEREFQAAFLTGPPPSAPARRPPTASGRSCTPWSHRGAEADRLKSGLDAVLDGLLAR